MSESESKKRREQALFFSLLMFHAWGVWLVFQPVHTETDVKMFEAVCWGVLANLGILAGEKVLRLLVQFKWGGNDQKNRRNSDPV